MPETCPKCGNPGTRYLRKEGERIYVYYAHYQGKGLPRRKCYAGPLEEYKYVESQHGLGLGGIESTDYFEVSIEALRKYVEKMWREAEKNPKALPILESRLYHLEKYIREERGRILDHYEQKRRSVKA